MINVGTFLPVAAASGNVPLRRYWSLVEPLKPSLPCQSLRTLRYGSFKNVNGHKLLFVGRRQLQHRALIRPLPFFSILLKADHQQICKIELRCRTIESVF
jgi:hypothetical protein